MKKTPLYLLKVLVLASALFNFGCVNAGDENAAVGAKRIDYPYPPIRMSPSIQYLLPNQSAKLFPEGGSGYYSFSIHQGLGVVNQSGFFTAGTSAGTTVVKIGDDAGGQGFGTVVTLNPLELSPANSFVTISQKKQFTATGGLPPYKYSILDAGKGTINATSGLLTAPPVVGVTLVRVEDSLGNQTQVNVRYLEPLVVTPSVGFFPSNGNLVLTRAGGEGLLTYEFQQGHGLVVVDPITNTLIPNEGASGRVQLKITDAVGYTTNVTLDFFNPRKVAVGKSHACAVNSNRELYCWGANDRGQIGEVDYGPLIGDDPIEMGDALKSVTQFSGIVDFALTGHSTCMIHTVSGHRELKCWGAGDEVDNVDYNAWGGTWAEQNHAYGGTNARSGHLTRWWSDLSNGVGGGSADGNSVGVRSNVGDTLAHPLSMSVSTRLRAEEFGALDNLEKLIGVDSGSKHNMCYMSALGRIACQNTSYYPALGTASGMTHYNTGSTYLYNHLRGATADASQGGRLSAMGKILKASFSSSGYIGCYVMHVTGALKTTPIDYAAMHGGRKRIICMNGFFTSNDNNIAALKDGAAYQNGIATIPRSTGTYTSTIFTSITKHPEFAHLFDIPNEADLDAIDVASGGAASCAIFENGATDIVKCWGSNANGGLGIGNTNLSFADTAPPYQNASLPANENPEAIYTTGNNSFCVKTHNSVTSYKNLFCWGRNDFGQLGFSGPANVTSPVAVDLSGLQGMNYVLEEIKTASHTMCGRFSHATQPHQLYCWGHNQNAILGAGIDPQATAFVTSPTAVMLGGAIPFSVKAFDISDYHGCAADTTDKIKCWGGREFGKLGAYRAYIQGDEPQETGAGLNKANMTSGRTVYNVYAGYKHTCMILSGNEEGQLMCFGANGDRQLGRAESAPYLDVGAHHQQKVDTAFTLNRTKLDNDAGANSKVIKVAGHYSMFALTNTGTLFSWGDNRGNALGRGGGPGSATSTPTKLSNIGAVKDVTSSTFMKDGYARAFACLTLAANGHVHCWGNNHTRALGRLGGDVTVAVNTNTTPSNTKVELGNFKAVALSSGHGHVCALSDLGKVKCWGDNSVGQLGIGVTNNNGSSSNGPIPLNNNSEMGDNLREVNLGTDVAGIPYTVKQLTSGDNHNCALFTDGRAKCWGDNAFGQLGLGTKDTVGAIDGQMGNNLGFVSVGPGATIIQITAGGDTTCAVLSNNDVKCWGDNTAAQLGVGDKRERGTSALNTGTNLQRVEFPQ